MNVNDDTKLDAAIEEQYSSQHRSKVMVFLRRLSCYLINFALFLGYHVLIISMLMALFQHTLAIQFASVLAVSERAPV